MFKLLLRAFVITLGLIGPAMAQERILISSDWGKVTAELVDNNATRSLVQMLPLTIEMRDHLRQEKTGNLPSPLPAVERQLARVDIDRAQLRDVERFLRDQPREAKADDEVGLVDAKKRRETLLRAA